MIYLLLALVSFPAWADCYPLRLTGPGLTPVRDFADPSPPDFSEPGSVKIFGTAGEVLEWRDRGRVAAKTRFLRGDPPTHHRLTLFQADGKTALDEEKGEDAWDPSIQLGANGEKALYASVMDPPGNSLNATWPDDHWSRRTYAFRQRRGRWVREPEPLLGPLPKSPTWLGHSYGHGYFSDGNRAFLFYEKVTEEKDELPWKTELFARELKDSFSPKGKEIPVLLNPQRWNAAKRKFGGSLVEGARPFRAEGKILVAFSAGDYDSDRYGIHLLWADSVAGPYHPYLTPNGRDLKNFAESIPLPLTWGPGRPAFFSAEGEWWVLFHGIDRREDPSPKDGLRNLYLAPVKISPGRAGAGPQVQIKSGCR